MSNPLEVKTFSLSTDVKTIIASTAEPKLSRYNQMVLTSAAKSDLRTLRNFGPKKSLTLAPHSSELKINVEGIHFQIIVLPSGADCCSIRVETKLSNLLLLN